jgi:lactoylglutathione lyase
MMLKFVQTIGVSVSDQSRSEEFYTKILGFEKTNDQDMGDGTRWLVVQPPGTQTGIMLSKGQSAGGKEPGGFTGYVFYTDDMAATHAQLTARGVNFTKAPINEPWGKWAEFADPDGNIYGIWAAPEMG